MLLRFAESFGLSNTNIEEVSGFDYPEPNFILRFELWLPYLCVCTHMKKFNLKVVLNHMSSLHTIHFTQFACSIPFHAALLVQ